MSLRAALERLPHDRESEALIGEILAMFRRHEGDYFEPRRVAAITNAPEDRIGAYLEVMKTAFVLDFLDSPPRYAYRTDRLLEIELDRFTRRNDSKSGLLQNNVEKFRQRYGSR